MYSMKLVHQNLIKDLKGDIMRLINNKIFARRSIFPRYRITEWQAVVDRTLFQLIRDNSSPNKRRKGLIKRNSANKYSLLC